MPAETSPLLFTIRHPFVRLENVLNEREIADLLVRVMALQPQFQSSVAINVTNPEDVRKSLVFNPPADLVRPVVEIDFRKARATQIRCRSPTESFAPRSPNSVS